MAAPPVFHHVHESIEAHLTIALTALAVSRHPRAVTGVSIRGIVQTLRPLRSSVIEVNGHRLTVEPHVPDTAREIFGPTRTRGDYERHESGQRSRPPLVDTVPRSEQGVGYRGPCCPAPGGRGRDASQHPAGAWSLASDRALPRSHRRAAKPLVLSVEGLGRALPAGHSAKTGVPAHCRGTGTLWTEPVSRRCRCSRPRSSPSA